MSELPPRGLKLSAGAGIMVPAVTTNPSLNLVRPKSLAPASVANVLVGADVAFLTACHLSALQNPRVVHAAMPPPGVGRLLRTGTIKSLRPETVTIVLARDPQYAVCSEAPLASLKMENTIPAINSALAFVATHRFKDGKLSTLLRQMPCSITRLRRGIARVSSATIQPSKSSRSHICGQLGAFDGRWFLPRTHH